MLVRPGWVGRIGGLSAHQFKATATPATTLLLDETGLGSAAAAYSVRKLRAAYSGSAIRVRRSSDSTEQDIGFSGNDLDESALTTFCGAGDGFVVTWYDQSGNARHLTNATATEQPQIVSSGAVIKINGKAAAQFDGTNDWVFKGSETAGSLLGSGYENCTAVVMQQDGTQVSNGTIGARVNSAQSCSLFATSSDSIQYDTGNDTTRSVSVAQPAGWDGTQQLVVGYSTGADGYIRTNGVQRATSGMSGTPTKTTSTNLGLGRISSVYQKGYIQESVSWAADKSSAISTLESNQNTYFGVY